MAQSELDALDALDARLVARQNSKRAPPRRHDTHSTALHGEFRQSRRERDTLPAKLAINSILGHCCFMFCVRSGGKNSGGSSKKSRIEYQVRRTVIAMPSTFNKHGVGRIAPTSWAYTFAHATAISAKLRPGHSDYCCRCFDLPSLAGPSKPWRGQFYGVWRNSANSPCPGPGPGPRPRRFDCGFRPLDLSVRVDISS
ncbi:hypothetical protein TARUN_7878 [Trichoderma arundinaceum]|uniref:Uncharacterized protein n=1 Tax=Trichoderma arundinaceum TaxID=490622 RepID=A0A395NE43_TRIAR|nr:hypothetical protein TARUN_7878 [Trichoderma arundinaceum]